MRSHGSYCFSTRPAGGAGPSWVIQCAPHVALRLKRVFAKLGKAARGAYLLSDTPENARELEWFCDRFPLDAREPKDLEYLAERAKAHRDKQALVDEMLAGQRPMPAFKLAIPARAYQKEAAAMYLASGGLLLADAIGLGKSCAAICTFCDPRTLPALVVTETHLPMQWRRELRRFLPDLRAHILQKTEPYNLFGGCQRRAHEFDGPEADSRCRRCDTTRQEAKRGQYAKPDVLITSYSKIHGWAETLSRFVQSVVYDEVQALRRAEDHKGPTVKYASAQTLSRSVPFRLGLSASPIYNMGSEIFNVLDCIFPDGLGSHEEFRTEWGGEARGDQYALSDPQAFGLYAREAGLMIRRTRSDVNRELPRLTNIETPVEADMSAIDEVSDKCSELARFLLGDANSMLDLAANKGAKMQASEEMVNRLRQATGVAKAPFVAEFVRMAVGDGTKIILAGWHRLVYQVWLERLKDFGPVMYTGSETAHQKDKSRAAFVDGSCPILIMSLRSGAGLDGLQKVCSTVVYGELDWSPQVHHQLSGRVHRDGQEQPVFAHYLTASVGADPVIIDVLGLKESQSHGLLDPDAPLVETRHVDKTHVKRLAAAWLEQRRKA